MAWLVPVLAAGMFAVGQWGSRNVHTLLSPHLDEEQREQQHRVMRRGAIVLRISAVVLVLVAAFALIQVMRHG